VLHAKAFAYGLRRLNHRRLGPYLRHWRKARPATLHSIAQITIPASPEEILHPPRPSVGRGFPGGPRHPATMPEQQRDGAARFADRQCLGVRLLGAIASVAVDHHWRRTFSHLIALHRHAVKQHGTPSHMERPHVPQSDGTAPPRTVSGFGSRHSYCTSILLFC